MKKLLLQCILFPWGILVLTSMFAPISFGINPFIAILIILFSILLWILIILSSRDTVRLSKLDTPSHNGFEAILNLLFWVYIISAYLNFFILEDRSLFSIVAQREIANIQGPSPSIISGIASLLAAAPALLIAVMTAKKNKRKKIHIIIFYSMLAIPPLLFSGGRNPIVLAILFILVYQFAASKLVFDPLINKKIKRFFSKKNLLIIAPFIFIAPILLYYIMYITVARRRLTGTLDTYAEILRNDYGLETTPIYDMLLNFGNEITVAYTSLFYYISHGTIMFERLLHVENISHTLGYVNFTFAFFIFDFAFGANSAAILSQGMVFIGSYLGLWGAIYQDFGVVGLFVMPFILSCFIYLILARSSYGSLSLSWYSIIALTFVVSPVYSFTSTGYGFSMLFVLTISSIIILILKKR